MREGSTIRHASRALDPVLEQDCLEFFQREVAHGRWIVAMQIAPEVLKSVPSLSLSLQFTLLGSIAAGEELLGDMHHAALLRTRCREILVELKVQGKQLRACTSDLARVCRVAGQHELAQFWAAEVCSVATLPHVPKTVS
jgi:hypothetical protein